MHLPYVGPTRKKLKRKMENSTFRLFQPGKLGFFFFGVVFILVLGSWQMFTRTTANNSEEAEIVIKSEKEFSVYATRHIFNSNVNPNLNLKSKASHKQSQASEKDNTKYAADGAPLNEKSLSSTPVPHTGSNQWAKTHQRIPTFLSTLENSFIGLQLTSEGGIPTLEWIEACAAPKNLLESLGSLMDRVWGDISNNIRIIQKCYERDPVRFGTLQGIVLEDIERGTALKDGSNAMAVLWLKRAYEFCGSFFDYIIEGKDPSTAASTAYSETLSSHHSFFVKPLFYTGFKMLGPRKDVLQKMAVDDEDFSNPEFEVTALEDMKKYTDSLKVLLNILHNFLEEHEVK